VDDLLYLSSTQRKAQLVNSGKLEVFWYFTGQ